MRGELVEGAVDLIQGVAVFGAEEASARGVGNLLQALQVDLGFALGIRVADADGVNHHAFGRGHGGRVIRGDGAAGVVAVGEQDQHFFLLVGLLQQFQAQADGVADGRVGAGHADAGVVQQQ
ncbi:hypothetical protein D3C71_1468290 [compost metagenome]